jgi:hypothetical protein
MQTGCRPLRKNPKKDVTQPRPKTFKDRDYILRMQSLKNFGSSFPLARTDQFKNILNWPLPSASFALFDAMHACHVISDPEFSIGNYSVQPAENRRSSLWRYDPQEETFNNPTLLPPVSQNISVGLCGIPAPSTSAARQRSSGLFP